MSPASTDAPARSIIVAAPPVYGETAPLLQTAEGLVQRGHRVTALVGSAFVDAAAETGATVVALHGAADFDLMAMVNRPERRAIEPGPAQLNWDHTEIFMAGLADQHAALQGLLEAEPDAALVCNSLFFGAWPVALGAPGRSPRRWVAMVANPVILGDDATTLFGPLPGPDLEQRIAANRAANEGFDAAFDATTRAGQEILSALGASGTLPPYWSAVYALPDAMVALTVPEFDFPRASPPANLHYGGVLPIRAQGNETLPGWWAELNDDRPVVVVTQGTTANSDLSMLVEPTLRALADLDVLVIAALGRPADELGIDPPVNARVEEWVHFDRLLPRVDLLVTNGGFGGTQHALEQGVPVIVAGTTEDKPMVAAHVSFHGVGIDLATQTPSAEEVRTAVSTVLGEASYRDAARRMSKAYIDLEPISVVEALLSEGYRP